MNYKKFLCLATFLFFGLSFAYSQCESQNKLMVIKIDSIAKANNIVEASIVINKLSSMGGNLNTNEFLLAKKKKFIFDGQFLVVDKNYFNLQKLLYFIVKDEQIIFVFQNY